MFLTAPSTIEVGESFSIGVKILVCPYRVGSDSYRAIPSTKGRYNLSARGITYLDNVPVNWQETVEIEGGNGYQGPQRYSFKEGTGPYLADRRPIRRIGGMRFISPGSKFITLKEPESGTRREAKNPSEQLVLSATWSFFSREN